MKVTREGRIITIEVEASDLNPRLEEELQLDAFFSGAKFAASHEELVSKVCKLMEIELPSEVQQLTEDFRERWELPAK